jgi:hypothetical protein
LDGRSVLWWSLESVLARVVAVGGETVTGWCLELEFLAVLVLERIRERVEVECAGNGQGHNEVG